MNAESFQIAAVLANNSAIYKQSVAEFVKIRIIAEATAKFEVFCSSIRSTVWSTQIPRLLEATAALPLLRDLRRLGGARRLRNRNAPRDERAVRRS